MPLSQPRGESKEQKLHHVIMVIMPANRAPHGTNTAGNSSALAVGGLARI